MAENQKEFPKLDVKNAEQTQFRMALKRIKNGEYEVEQLKDGKKILISKPGYKGEHDIKVNLYDPIQGAKTALSHNDLFKDIENKNNQDFKNTQTLIKGLLDVCNGKEPDAVIKEKKIENSVGLPVDTLLKIYKWIWGQEDCNYPRGKGRWFSMDALREKFIEEEED